MLKGKEIDNDVYKVYTQINVRPSSQSPSFQTKTHTNYIHHTKHEGILSGKIPKKPVWCILKYEFKHEIMESGMVKGKSI